MPSLLSSFTGEKVKLASNEESPYKPPQQVTETAATNTTNASKTNNSYATGPGAVDSPRTESSHDARPNGTHNISKSVVGSSVVNGVNGHTSKIEGITDGPELNGDSRSHQDLGQGTQATENPLKQNIASGSTQGPEPPEDSSRHTRGSLEKVLPGNARQKGHARIHSSSAPQHISSTLLDNVDRPPTTSVPSSSLENGLAAPKATRMSNTSLQEMPLSATSLHPNAPKLLHRHTLEVPRVSSSRTSRDFAIGSHVTNDTGSESDRLTPTVRTPRASYTLARAPTRSIHSDLNFDEVPSNSDMARWAETVKQKRASRRKRKDEEEDDRVVVGTKVDINHVNWVTAYNMLTGIRFTVSRTHAKIDRELTDPDFDAANKFSFDVTGNELTPSAKYDFKFKDYAPWVFRHIRARFHIDPANYLMSLTSKYILSELGSPGKSGSFFYFSRDYKYIIKTIHHAEHKLLRKILREYYAHIEKHPNTLISQFYGLHRVKIPYGRKIHFVVMNNLFPPHRDIHQTFDLKGSTIGRNFEEDDLAHNPRATLKDLNWLRRDYHFEFGPDKKTLFVEQLRRDVALLQKLQIMDYSLLVGIHDLNKGNEENLRDKTLQVFQPGGDEDVESQSKLLSRTPTKLDNVRQAKQLREMVRKERPVPIDQSTSRMPEELEEQKAFIFYSDDGGFRATHEDGRPGEKVYYLGVIDCLTHYGMVKRAEHIWKGLSNNKSQISPIPPVPYGERFTKFISGLTKTPEEVEREVQAAGHLDGVTTPSQRQPSWSISRSSTDKVVEKAEKQARKSEKEGAHEEKVRDRTISTASAGRSPSTDRGAATGATLPVVQEDGEISQEASLRDEKSRPPTNGLVQDNEQKGISQSSGMLPNIPSLNRLSLGQAMVAK